MIGVQRHGPVAPRLAAEYRSVSDQIADFRATAGPTDRDAGRAADGAEAAWATQPAADVERDAWVVLLSVSGLGPVSFGALLAAFGSARAVLDASAEPGGCERLLEALVAAAARDAAAGAVTESDAAVFDACAAPPTLPAGPGLPWVSPHGARQLIGRDLALRICDAAQNGSVVVARIRSLGLRAVTLEEPGYPDRLRRVELPPPLLFLRGEAAAMSATHAVAVVGTRWPTDKGRLIAGWIGSALAQAGAVVVSGLAVGIDGAAHASVVAEGGRTVAVLGGGHAHLFPKAHERLADAIVSSGGAVVSEHAPDTNPSRGTFPRRNRLVSGLSDATVVVEAGVRSGALITAGWALEQGRECFLVPGAFDSPASAGCHAFLRSFPGQARLVSGIAELIEDLEIATTGADVTGAGTAKGAATTPGAAPATGATARPVRASAPPASMPGPGRAAAIATLGPVERAIAEQLAAGPATADQLAGRTSLASAAILSALTLLELRGLVTAAYGRYAPAGPLAGWSGPCSAASRRAI
jgi:DNA processing protein